MTVLGGAGIGGHSIQVDRLASSAQHGFNYTPSADAGKLELRLRQRRPPRTVRSTSPPTPPPTDIAAADQRQRQAARSTPPSSRTAGPDKLVFSSRKTGENSDFTVDTSALGAGSSMGEDNAYKRDGRDAQRVDQGRRRAPRQPRVQRPREHDPGRARCAEGHHGEPGVGQHDASPPSTTTRSRRRSRRSSTPTTRSSPPRAPSSPRSVSRPPRRRRTCRRASCSATPA